MNKWRGGYLGICRVVTINIDFPVMSNKPDTFVYLSVYAINTTLNWSGHLVWLVPNPHLTAHMLVISQWSSIAHLLITISTAHGYWRGGCESNTW